MPNRVISASCFLLFAVSTSFSQARSTAARSADLQVGVGFVYDKSDYTDTLKGGAVYATLDLTNHLGGEFVIHQAKSSNGDSLYERSYEIGPRYFRHYGVFAPYVKAMYGRGVFNFPSNVANLAYNMFAFGVGADVRVLRFLNVRADYEYQDWLSFPPRGLKPQVLTFGVAYHFPGELRRGRHY